jgi:Omp85 superfamily domain
MRALPFACALILVAAALPAQGVDTTRRVPTLSGGALPYDVAVEVVDLYNEPAMLRATDSLDIPADQTVDGNVTVLDGPLTLAGQVKGRVVVINGDVRLEPGARVGGDVVVVGGTIDGEADAKIGGRVRQYAQKLNYHRDGELLVADREHSSSDVSWFRRWLSRHQRSQSKIIIAGGTYNRVEGLPVIIGPSIRQNTGWGSVRVEGVGLYRSADNFEWKDDNLGYDATAEVRVGRRRAIAVGVRLFDVVDAAEPWQLRDSEISLASFFLHRDYRDYFERHGARGYVSLLRGGEMGLTLSYGVEHWGNRGARDPITLFRNSEAWRPNPVMDEGRFTVTGLTFTVDTRNTVNNPWAGWLVTADLEHGSSPAVIEGSLTDLARPVASGPVAVAYTRGFLDVRRYNRVSPSGQLNFRVVLGGWLGGDPLPLQRRFSLGGAGTLPGYDFRRPAGNGADVLTCGGGTAIEGTPAQCDRMALAQVEYRRDITTLILGHSGGGLGWSFYHPVSGVVFLDAGRGWLVGSRLGDLRYPSGSFPGLDTFRSDVGVGIDVDILGVFLAKSLSDPGNPPNFVIRLRHRF